MIPEIDLNDFNYDLPKERIADFPLESRDNSKLLFVNPNTDSIEHYKFNQIVEFIPENSLLIMNSTKVIAARIPVTKSTGGKAEILCIEPVSPSFDPQVVMNSRQTCRWNCIIGGRKIHSGDILKSENQLLNCKILEKNDNIALVEFEWDNRTFAEILNLFGRIPLPPYIKREATEFDNERYQTVYAKSDGSVAAPTAGLHFSDNVMEQIKSKSVEIAEVVLHVGPGTFLPIETDSVNQHTMHFEQFFIDKTTIESIYSALKNKKNIIATGTTSIRTIESLYILGAKLLQEKITLKDLFVNQEDAYLLDNEENIPSPEIAIQHLLNEMHSHNLKQINGKTQLFIVPGFKFQIADSLITNFHLPKSTLLLLVAAFIGKDYYEKSYKSALDNNYRFLSYGDSSLLIRKK